MEDTTIERGIAHLDFPIEEEKPKDSNNVKHWAHPTDPDKCWCGQQGTRQRYENGRISASTSITCPGCLHQFIEKGGAWWWQVHNLYFGSTCTTAIHNCGQ